MKAIVCTKYGPPEVLKIQELPKPSAKHGEILIKIVATAVNSGDVRVRGLQVKGVMKVIMRLVIGFNKPRKPVLGTVFSGIVETIGSSVTKFKKGDEVFGMTGFKFGTYAEYLVLKEQDNVLLKPKNASFEEAAALPFGGQTAIYFLQKAGIEKLSNSELLILGATGSVGIAATQIAKEYQARITAVCSSSGVKLVESFGVSKVIQYNKEEVSKLTSKYDIVFDAVGSYSKKQCKKLLKKGGVYKTVGGMEVANESINQLELLKELYEKGRYNATIDKIFQMDQVVEAHKYVDTGRKKGNGILSG